MARLQFFRVDRASQTVCLSRDLCYQVQRSNWLCHCFVTLALTMLLLTFISTNAYAGGPRYVAGASFFDRTTMGTPIIWSSGQINYYTDQGGLGPALPDSASADAFVAGAFSRWTSIATAAIGATQAGKLDEDVTGASLATADDIAPTATDKPIAIVYDADGSVTDALMGQGASSPANCFTGGVPLDGNAVFGGPDNFSTDAHLAHALVVINGQCTQNSQQLPDLEYRLVRVLGQVLGLDWSQANLDPGPGDDAGFPVMHGYDPVSCVPISSCYSQADQPKMDDIAAISRLYPVTQANLNTFPNKTLFHENTVRIYGSVYFQDASGQPAQPMQGVNVVARLIDPTTFLASRTYVASSVSGFLFRGNAGNAITGFTDSSGLRFDRFGSDDTTLEGYYDLGGLEVTDPSGIAEYQITVEPLDPEESEAVEPYAPWQVTPSGTAPPATVFITLDNDVELDMTMTHSALQLQDPFGPQSFASPAAVPGAGDWTGTLSGYGDADYFQFPALANRTLSVEATALDGGGNPTQNKALPVVGMWTIADTSGPPELATSEVFNGAFGTTRLDAALAANTVYRMGVADYRGDGRPDYRYEARIFYGNQVTPARASVAGGTPLIVQGLGFRANTVVSIGGVSSPLLAIAAGKLLVSAPPLADGVWNLDLADPATGASSSMTGVLTYGAGPGDTIRFLPLTSANKAPLGGEVPSPITAQVVGPDGVTPVAGASVYLQAAPATLSACGGATGCTLLTDESGLASTRVVIPASVPAIVLNSGIAVTAQIAPASYPVPSSGQLAQTTVAVAASSSPMDVVLTLPNQWVAQGATIDLPLTAIVLSNGVPQGGQTVQFSFLSGSGPGSLSTTSALTDGSGTAGAMLHVSGFAAEVKVSACAGSQSCANFDILAVGPAALRLQPVSGSAQVVATGQAFQPVVVRVADTLGHPVAGVAVEFQAIVTPAENDPPSVWIGDTNINPDPPPVVLASYQITAESDSNGLAMVQPPSSSVANVVVSGTAATGVARQPFSLQAVPPLSTPPVSSSVPSKIKVEEGAR